MSEQIIIRPAGHFNVNGKMEGTLMAFYVWEEGSDRLFWQETGNWSRAKFQEDAASKLSSRAKLMLGLDISDDFALQLIGNAMDQAYFHSTQQQDQPSEPAFNNEVTHTLPVINTSGRYLREIADDAWQILERRNQQRAEFVCFGDAVSDLVETENGVSPRVLTLASLRNRLDRLADFIRFNKEGEERPARPPKDVLEDMLAQANPHLPRLQGVVKGPVCRSDGSILTTEGYDQETGLYVAMGNLVLPSVPDYPSDDDIRRAKALILDEVLVDFPFASESDKAHAVSEIISPVVRHMISGPTPLHDNESPSPGTGKDLLADIVSLIHTGVPPPAMTEGRSDDEWRKRLTAKLITSPTMILITNIKRKLDSGALSAALERPIWEDRVLGLSRNVSVPIRCTWICTANNPEFSEEIARRLVRVRMDSGIENPWERTGFKHEDLRAWVKQHRGELLWALFILIRAWVVKGKPHGDVTIGSYERWSEIVGGILKVAEIPGFLGNRQEVYNQARTDIEGLRAFLPVWWNAYKQERVGVDKLFDLARDQKLLTELRSGRSDHGARISLGMLLSASRDRVIGGYTVKQVGPGHAGVMIYQLLEICPETGADKVFPQRKSPKTWMPQARLFA